MEGQSVSSATLKRGVGRVTVTDVPLKPGVQRELFRPLADGGIFVDDIIQNETGPGVANIAFTIAAGDLEEAERLLTGAIERIDGQASMKVARGLAKVAAIGVGMRSHSGVAATMFAALADAGVLIENISTSEIAISCLVPEADGETALRAVHEAFELGGAPLTSHSAQRRF